MIEDIAMAVSTGAAGNIVAYMLNGQVDALRAQLSKIFRHGTEQEQLEALHALEVDGTALAQKEMTQDGVFEEWGKSLFSYWVDHPEAHGDMEAFASTPIVGKSSIVGAQNFYGPGSFGGDNNGTINIIV